MKIGNREKDILAAVGVGALLVGAVLVPGLSLALTPFLSKNRYGRQNVQKSIKRLQDKDLIYLSGEKIKLTKRGREILKRVQVEDIIIHKTEWDGIWRLVTYDIPEKYKKQRDYFRTKLLYLGFLEVQKSMYVIPYECLEEIAVFAQSIGVAPFVMYLTTLALPQQKQYLRRFGL